MLNKALIILLIAISSEALSQKILQKEIDINDVESLIVNVDQVFSVRVIAKETSKIMVTTKVRGESFENVVVNISEENNDIIISTGFSPFFVKENDKLAAHKIIAIEMVIVIPKNLNISITSKIASVIAEGDFRKIYAGLENGNCTLDNFTGNATLQTKKGSIVVYANRNIAGTAISRKGKIINRLPERGKYYINAESTTGSISLLQTN